VIDVSDDALDLKAPGPKSEAYNALRDRATRQVYILVQFHLVAFLLPLVYFTYRLAELTSGKVFFTAGKDLERYVVLGLPQSPPRYIDIRIPIPGRFIRTWLFPGGVEPLTS